MSKQMSEQDRFNAWLLGHMGCPDAVIAYVLDVGTGELPVVGMPPSPSRPLSGELAAILRDRLLTKGVGPNTLFLTLGLR